MTEDTDPCMWKGCAKRAQKRKNFCPEHVNECTEASSKLRDFVWRAAEGIGWGIVGNALTDAIRDSFGTGVTFMVTDDMSSLNAAYIVEAKISKDPEVGARLLFKYLQSGRLNEAGEFGPPLRQTFLAALIDKPKA